MNYAKEGFVNMTTDRSYGHQNYLFVTLIVVSTAIAVAANQFKVPTIMGNIASSLNMKDSSAPWLMSIFAFVGIFLALPTGSLVQKYGPKVMLVTASIFVGLGSLLGSFASTGSILILSRGIEGIGFIFAAVAGPLAIVRYVESPRIGFSMGIWAIWVPVGQILAFNLTPIMYGIMGWNKVWMFFAIIPLIMAGIAQSTLKGSVSNSISSSNLKVKNSAVFLKKNLWFLCFSFCIFNLLFIAMVTFAPFYLENSGMMNKTAAAFLTTIPMIFCIIFSPIFGRLSDIIASRKKILVLALLVLGPSVALIFSTINGLVYLGAILLGAIGMATPAMVLASVEEVVERPELTGSGMGLMMVFQNIGVFLGTIIFLPIVSIFDGSFSFAGLVLIPISFLGVYFTLKAKFK